MAVSVLTAYGAAALEGFGSRTTACSTGASGVQIEGAGGDIYLLSFHMGGTQYGYFFASDPSQGAGSLYPPNSSAFAAGDFIYVSAQTLDEAIGGITSLTAGWYEIVLIDSLAYGIYFNASSDTLPQPTACGAAPVADFTGAPTNPLQGAPVQFTDTSNNTPTSWNWTFSGGTPADSTVQNPTVTYNSVGTFNVSLEAENASGTDTEIKNGYITVDAFPYPTGSGDEDARYTTKFVDRDMTKLITQYDRNAFSSGSVPFRMTVRGPSNLRRRKTVYKVTKE